MLDGIRCHTKGVQARTLEGRVVRISDRIAYLNHDIDDAVRGGVIRNEDIPQELTAGLGSTKSDRIHTMVCAVIRNSDDDVRMDETTDVLFEKLHEFLFEAVYLNPTAKHEEGKVDGIVQGLYRYFVDHPEKMQHEYASICEQEGVQRAAADYVSGMTDHFAIQTYTDLFIPKSWDI